MRLIFRLDLQKKAVGFHSVILKECCPFAFAKIYHLCFWIWNNQNQKFVCEFWRIHKPEKGREADYIEENGRYAWRIRSVFNRCGKRQEKLTQLAKILGLSNGERELMFNLAGKKRNAVAPDLPEYIMERDSVSAALRTARDLDAGEEEWNQFVEELRIDIDSFAQHYLGMDQDFQYKLIVKKG